MHAGSNPARAPNVDDTIIPRTRVGDAGGGRATTHSMLAEIPCYVSFLFLSLFGWLVGWFSKKKKLRGAVGEYAPGGISNTKFNKDGHFRTLKIACRLVAKMKIGSCVRDVECCCTNPAWVCCRHEVHA